MFILIHLFFPFVSFKGHGILKRHSIKRNLGGAGNHQVIETTQGAEKIEEKGFVRVSSYICLRNSSIFSSDIYATMRTDSPKMTDVEPVVNNFASSARAGRRNAVPDIQGSTAAGGTLEELPVKLEALSVKEGNTQNPLRVSGSYLFLIISSGTVSLLTS
uniref:Uncharacterized protein n=1 Tax=Bos mutus grunniens TaxID=30521 RepID=A0A8B9X4B1_BOSMU